MRSPPIALVVGALSLSLLSISVNCSAGFTFDELIPKFEWIDFTGKGEVLEAETTPPFEFKFHERSFDRRSFKLPNPRLSVEGEVSDRFPLNLPRDEQLEELILKAKSKGSCFFLMPKLYNALKQYVFDYLKFDELKSIMTTIPEFAELLDGVIKNRILRTFPRMISVNITGKQSDLLYLSAKLLSHIYPLLDLKTITNTQDLGALIQLSWIISNNSRDLDLLEKAYLNKFISALTDSDKFAFNNPVRLNVFEDLVTGIMKSDKTAISKEFLFESDSIVGELSIQETSSFWKIMKNYHSIERFGKMFEHIRKEEKMSESQVAEKMLRIFKSCDNGTLLRAYLSYEQENDSFSKYKLIKLIALIFDNCYTGLFNEITVNPVTRPFLIESPELLLLLPENRIHFFFTDFMECYISTEFYQLLGPGQDLISLSLLTGDRWDISKVLSVKGLIPVLPTQFYELYHLFSNEGQNYISKYDYIQSFWYSLAVFSVFTNELTLDERIKILNEVIESRDYHSMYALSRSVYDYYAVTPGISPYPNAHDRTEFLINTTDYEAGSFNFFSTPLSEDSTFISDFLKSNNFKLHPELHCSYIFMCLEVYNYKFLGRLFKSKNTQIPDDQIMEIFHAMKSRSLPIWVTHFFFKNHQVLMFILSDENEEDVFIEVLKYFVRFNRLEELKYFLECLPYHKSFVEIKSFDIIGFCLSESGVEISNDNMRMLHFLWKQFVRMFSHNDNNDNNDNNDHNDHNNNNDDDTYLHLHLLYEKYINDQSFMELINSGTDTSSSDSTSFSFSSSSSD